MLGPKEWVLFLAMTHAAANLAWNVAGVLTVLVHYVV